MIRVNLHRVTDGTLRTTLYGAVEALINLEHMSGSLKLHLNAAMLDSSAPVLPLLGLSVLAYVSNEREKLVDCERLGNDARLYRSEHNFRILDASACTSGKSK